MFLRIMCIWKHDEWLDRKSKGVSRVTQEYTFVIKLLQALITRS